MTTAQPETIHDFGGPAELTLPAHPAPGAPDIAQLAISGWRQRASPHVGRPSRAGPWRLGTALPPVASGQNSCVPGVAALGITAEQCLALGQALALREQGVLIISSGSMTHNLYAELAAPDSPLSLMPWNLRLPGCAQPCRLARWQR